MLCKQCGHEVEQTQEVCGYCGQRLTVAAREETAKPQPIADQGPSRIPKRDFVRYARGHVPLYRVLLDVAFCPMFVILAATVGRRLFNYGYSYIAFLLQRQELITVVEQKDMIAAMQNMILISFLTALVFGAVLLTLLIVAYTRHSIVLSVINAVVYAAAFCEGIADEESGLSAVLIVTVLTVCALLSLVMQILLQVEYTKRASLCEIPPKPTKAVYGMLKWFLLIVAAVLAGLLSLLWSISGGSSEDTQERYGAESLAELKKTLSSEYCFTQEQVDCMTAPMYAWLADECTDHEITSRADENVVQECNDYLFDTYDAERVKIVIDSLLEYDGELYNEDFSQEVRREFGEYIYTQTAEEAEALEHIWIADCTLIGENGSVKELEASDDCLLIYCIDGRYYWSWFEMY